MRLGLIARCLLRLGASQPSLSASQAKPKLRLSIDDVSKKGDRGESREGGLRLKPRPPLPALAYDSFVGGPILKRKAVSEMAHPRKVANPWAGAIVPSPLSVST